MTGMFQDATRFNQPLDNWDVGRVEQLRRMFAFASDFNQNINQWDISLVTDLTGVYQAVKNFDQPLNKWNTAHVKSMRNMFQGAYAFNQDLSRWDVSRVKSTKNMFLNAVSSDQDLANWDLNKLKGADYMLSGSAMSCKNYGVSLQGWSEDPNTPKEITLGADGVNYKAKSKVARKRLTDTKQWAITGDSLGNCAKGDPIKVFQDLKKRKVKCGLPG